MLSTKHGVQSAASCRSARSLSASYQLLGGNMTQGKIQFQLGGLSFSGEGSETWLAKQLEFVLSKVPEVSNFIEPVEADREAEGRSASKKPVQVGSLASHIKAKGAESNQTQRFLAAADWLRLKGEKALETSMVSKALQDNQQKRLSNPADALNKNVAKGFCEKTGKGFFITPEGLKALGHDD